MEVFLNFVYHLFGSTVFADFILFKLCIFPPLFYIKVYAVRASKLYSFC